jgi:hypothetical protein
MKRAALILFVLACTLPLRADILVNSNFTDGRAHWRGDAKDLDTSGDLSNPSLQGGVIITLKKDKWSKVFQTFPVRNAKLYYTITFKLSPDYKIAPRLGTGSDAFSSADLTDVPGRMSGDFDENAWHLIVRNTGSPWEASFQMLYPDPSKPSPQTLTGRVGELPTDTEAVLLLLIPPGEGSVTLLKVSLSPNDPNPNN